MIESHHQPDLAWSDAAQQVTPWALHEIITALRIRKPQGDAQEFQIQLDALRTQIDLSDRQIIETLGRRMKIASQIGQLKQDNNVAILQSDRWYAILEQMIHEGTQLGLSEEFVQKLFKAIHQESINQQKSIGLQK